MAVDCGQDQYLNYTGTVVTATPMTLACWAHIHATGEITLMGVGRTINGTHVWELRAESVGGAAPAIKAYTQGSTLGSQAVSSAGPALNTWAHACAVFASSTDRRAFLNGGNKGTNATSRTPSSPTVIRIGAYCYLSGTKWGDAAVAEAGIWNVALGDDEVAMLALGVRPTMVRPQSLVAYWPLIGRCSPEVDLRSRCEMTWVNTPTVFAHPRVFYSYRPHVFRNVTAAPPAVGRVHCVWAGM